MEARLFACRQTLYIPYLPHLHLHRSFLDTPSNISTLPLTDPDILVLSTLNYSEPDADQLTDRGTHPASTGFSTGDQPAAPTSPVIQVGETLLIHPPP
jgi:hypothetical protein